MSHIRNPEDRTDVTWTDRFGDEHTHPLFTDVTWAHEAVRQTGLSTRTSNGAPELDYWMARHDLEVQYASEQSLPFKWAQAIVSAAMSGLPVTITRNLRDMTVTETMMVTQVFNGSHFYAKMWGGSGPVYLTELADVQVPHRHTVLHTEKGDVVLSETDR
jgi:hypothetical protein